MIVTVDEIREHCRLDEYTTTDYIIGIILAATNKVEQDSGHIVEEREVIQHCNGFPTSSVYNPYGAITLNYSPLTDVTKVEYFDTATKTWLEVSEDDYFYTGVNDVGYVQSSGWPICNNTPNSVLVTYTAGYASSSNYPELARHAVKMLVGHYIENREISSPLTIKTVPDGYDALICNLRWK